MIRARSKRQRNSSRPTKTSRSDSPPETISHAYKSPPAVVAFILIAAAGAAADLLTKHYAFAALLDRPGQMTEIIPGCFNLRLSTNPGVVFGLRLPPWLVLAATGLALIAVTALFASSSRRAWPLHAALAMVLGGALGNAYDRLFSSVRFSSEFQTRTGEVRDFIDMHLGEHHWPTYNIADVLLVVGVAIILLHSFRHRAKPAG